jgi:hypothetical protein
MRKALYLPLLALGAALCTLPNYAAAQTADEWKFRAILYGYFPDIGGKTTFSGGNTGGSIDVNASNLISDLEFAFMGFFEARRGRWGGFVDYMYLDVNGSSSSTRNFDIRGHTLPGGVTANLNLNLKGTIVTFAGEYAALADPASSVDILAGARLISVKENLGYQLSADVGPFVGPGRSGNSEAKDDLWDGIVGVKGRVAFGADRAWFVPWYVDVGTGQSDLTWQALAGIGYSFKWGQVLAAWRYLDYKFKSGSAIETLTFNGPAVGVAFNW